MLLARNLSETMAALRREVRAPVRLLYDELVRHLTEAATAEGALKSADVFPEFALPDDDGQFIVLSDLLKSGPLIINFYRGRWCPFCAATVEAMSAVTPTISAHGAGVIGVSPEAGPVSLSRGRSQRLNFRMLSDLDNGLALQCGLLFRLSDGLIREYRASNLDLAKIYGNGSWFLPIPATYIVMPDGRIGDAYVNPDFRYRMEPEEILRSLAMLKPR